MGVEKGLTSPCRGVCRIGDHGRSWSVRQRESTRACFRFGRHPAGGSSSLHFIRGGQVSHLSTDGVSRSPSPRSTEGRKTIALCIWTPPLWKMLSQMVFPLNLATARGEEVRALSEGPPPLQGSQVILPSQGSSGKASNTRGCKLGCPSSCKGRGLVFRHKSQAKPPPRVFLPVTASSERTQCGHVTHVSFQYHLPCMRTG